VHRGDEARREKNHVQDYAMTSWMQTQGQVWDRMVCQAYPAGLSKMGQPVVQFGSADRSLSSAALVQLNHSLPCRVRYWQTLLLL